MEIGRAVDRTRIRFIEGTAGDERCIRSAAGVARLWSTTVQFQRAG